VVGGCGQWSVPETEIATNCWGEVSPGYLGQRRRVRPPAQGTSDLNKNGPKTTRFRRFSVISREFLAELIGRKRMIMSVSPFAATRNCEGSMFFSKFQ
jgi:hypothetical protein